jgi:hypothetical protein
MSDNFANLKFSPCNWEVQVAIYFTKFGIAGQVVCYWVLYAVNEKALRNLASQLHMGPFMMLQDQPHFVFATLSPTFTCYLSDIADSSSHLQLTLFIPFHITKYQSSISNNSISHTNH